MQVKRIALAALGALLAVGHAGGVDAAGGGAPIVRDVVIDASSEAALREIDARGFERFSDD